MDFRYKEHFSATKVFINSFPVSALTGINVVLKGTNRTFYSIKSEPSNKVVPVSRSYEITLKREPDKEDDFTLPQGEFTLSVMDAGSHTIYRGCAIDRTEESFSSPKSKTITIVSNEKREFSDYRYFGGRKCTAEV